MKTIPEQLRNLPQWVCWGAPGKPRKMPYNPRTGYPAKAGQPDTWADFATAMQAVSSGRYEGVGFEFHNGIVGVDFDHCIQDGKLDPWVATWVEILNSYTEVSPSGTGLHVICIGKLPGPSVKRPEAEMYDSARYFTMTGNAYTPVRPVRAAQDALELLYEELHAKQNKTAQKASEGLSAQSGISDCMQTGLARDPVLAALYRGDRPNGNESADDMALLNKLAYWCNRDPDAMQAAFFASGHYQSKDDAHKKKAQRRDYLPRSIEKAVQNCARTAAEDRAAYTQQRSTPASGDVFGRKEYTSAPAQSTGMQLSKASEIPYEPPRWTIAPYFQRGKGTLIQGDNGSGKTAFICGIVAHVTTGRALLDNEIAAPGNVLMLSVEDDLPVLRGRIEADGGDLDKVYFMTNAAGMTFTSPAVENAIRQIDAAMVVFDPFQAFLGAGVDMFRANETRPKLAKLFEMCERNDCACAIIAHMAKNTDRSPVNKALGSVDIPAAMRSIMQLVRNPDNEDECIMVHVKCSNAPRGRSIAYRIGERGGVHWIGYSDMTADDLHQVVRRKASGIPYDREPLVQVFKQLIADKPGGGFWSYEDIRVTGAKILGFPPFYSTTDLKAKLSGPLVRELQEKDGLIVTCGHRSHGARGVRIERYQVPQGYQNRLDL